MSKTLIALAATAAIAIGAVAAPTQAEARHRGWVGPAIIGGLAAGAIIGSAAAASPYYYGPGPYYYYGPGPYYGPGCYIRRERVWDGWGWRWQRVRVCY
jgi:hypothetical protein